VSDRESNVTGVLTVRELAYHSGLGLTAVTGDAGLGRAIKGVHFSDADDPVPYLTSEGVFITTGRTWYDDPGMGLWILDRLASIDTAVMVVALGHFLDEVPPEVVERAKKLKLPVLTLPPGALTRNVLSYVYNVLASADLHRLRRTVALQNDLLDLLIAEAGADELLAKVATLIGMPMLLLDGAGAVITASGVTDARRMSQEVWAAWAELTDPTALGIVEVGASRYFCRDVILYGKLEVLIAASAERTSSTEFVDTALSFLQRLITLDLLKQRDEIVATRRLRRRLLRDLLDGSSAPDELTVLVADHGVDLDRPWRVAICDFGGAPHKGRRAVDLEDALVEAVDTYCGDRLIAFLSRPRATSLAVLLPDGYPSVGDGSARDLVLGLKTFAAGEPYRLEVAVGVSGAHRGPGAGPEARQQALDAMAAAQRGIDARGLVLFEELSGRFRLLQGQSGGALADIARRSIAPLLEYDARRHTHLLDTLRTLLDNHFAIQPTAEALFIHRNTLQKRTRRIETLLGVDLTDIDDLMELYLGLRALQLVGEAKVVGAAPARRQSRPAVNPEG
jgi:purine catabolism regulator